MPRPSLFHDLTCMKVYKSWNKETLLCGEGKQVDQLVFFLVCWLFTHQFGAYRHQLFWTVPIYKCQFSFSYVKLKIKLCHSFTDCLYCWSLIWRVGLNPSSSSGWQVIDPYIPTSQLLFYALEKCFFRTVLQHKLWNEKKDYFERHLFDITLH